MPKKRAKHRRVSTRALTFARYQREVESTDESKKYLVSLLGLVGELGDVQTIVKRRLELPGGYPNYRRDMAEELGDMLWYVASLASRVKLSLHDIAASNIDKAKALHSRGAINYFDRRFPPDERLPRKFDVVFTEKPLHGGVQVKIIVNKIFVGDALTDNSQNEDGYRYHDAFHLTYGALSDVELKRRSYLAGQMRRIL